MSPLEKLRRVWTPEREIEEVIHRLEPQTELDSMVRDFLHRIIQQNGATTLDLEIFNTGTLRWEIIHHEPIPGVIGKRQVTLWVE